MGPEADGKAAEAEAEAEPKGMRTPPVGFPGVAVFGAPVGMGKGKGAAVPVPMPPVGAWRIRRRW